MDENKWEYDYSSSNNPAGDTGYPLSLIHISEPTRRS